MLLLAPSSFLAQEHDHAKPREKIKALKAAHITEGLDLTSEEAEKFWPIYNRFESKRRELFRREHAEIRNLDCMDEEDANFKLEEYVELERQDYLLKKRYYQDLRNIFSAKRIMKLEQVEDEFNEKLMREYRARNRK